MEHWEPRKVPQSPPCPVPLQADPPPKESRHLLLHPPQSPLLDDDLVPSKLHWCWNWSRLGLRSCRQDSPFPGYSWCRLQSLSPCPRWRDLHSSHPQCLRDVRSSSGTPSSRRSPTQTSADPVLLSLKNTMCIVWLIVNYIQ